MKQKKRRAALLFLLALLNLAFRKIRHSSNWKGNNVFSITDFPKDRQSVCLQNEPGAETENFMMKSVSGNVPENVKIKLETAKIIMQSKDFERMIFLNLPINRFYPFPFLPDQPDSKNLPENEFYFFRKNRNRNSCRRKNFSDRIFPKRKIRNLGFCYYKALHPNPDFQSRKCVSAG